LLLATAIRLQSGRRKAMAHEELPIPVNGLSPFPRAKGNSYAGSCRSRHGCKLVEIEGDRKVVFREEVLKVKD